MIKLNLGSHNKRVEGYKNVDIQPLENVDIVHDLTDFPYPFKQNSVDEILSQEFLEHISFRIVFKVLREWHRILKPGGKVFVQVPDIEAMCRMIDLQCNCVPRKASNYADYKADPNCFECEGKALIHPERWKTAFTGAQKHKWDAHLNHFVPEELINLFYNVGFIDVKRKPNIYKIVLEVTK